MTAKAVLTVWLQLTRRMVSARYRTSVLGVVWVWALPLLMLGVYAFVFTQVFAPRWPVEAENGSAGFVTILFAGLLVYGAFSETVLQSAQAITGNPNFVTKTVFPLGSLPLSIVGAAGFNLLVGFVILGAVHLVMGRALPLTVLWLPVVLLPFLFMLCGLALLLAAVGTYLRDVNHVLAPLSTAALFLAPILYPISAIPETVRPYVWFNPVSLPADQVQAVVAFGRHPDWSSLGIYLAASLFVLGVGYGVFQKTRAGFADVL